MSVRPPACLLLEAAFPNLGVDMLTQEGGFYADSGTACSD